MELVELQEAIDGGRAFVNYLKQTGTVERFGNAAVAKMTLLLDHMQRDCNKMALKQANEELKRDAIRQEEQYYGQKKSR